MFISESEKQRRLQSNKNLLNNLNGHARKVPVASEPSNLLPDESLPDELPVPQIKFAPMRGEYSQRAPDGLKIIAASLVAQGERPANVQQAFGLSGSQIRSASERPEVKHTIERVRELAMDKMLIALGVMTPDKFQDASLKDLSSITANLARVIDKTSPRELGPTVQFIVHTPEQKVMSHYKVVDV